jgi:hypothetical protein
MSDILDKDGLPGGLKSFIRTLGVALVTTVIILAGLQLLYGSQARQRDQLAETTAAQTQAVVSTLRAGYCVLGLDIGPDGQRDPVEQEACWENEGLVRPVP